MDLRMGMVTPSFDTAPAYAAQLVVSDTSMNNLFTAQKGTCPTILSDGAPCDPTKKDQQCDTFAYCVNSKRSAFAKSK